MCDMGPAEKCGDIFLKCAVFVLRKSPVQETLADIVHCLSGRMAHILCVKSVVT